MCANSSSAELVRLRYCEVVAERGTQYVDASFTCAEDGNAVHRAKRAALVGL